MCADKASRSCDMNLAAKSSCRDHEDELLTCARRCSLVFDCVQHVCCRTSPETGHRLAADDWQLCRVHASLVVAVAIFHRSAVFSKFTRLPEQQFAINTCVCRNVRRKEKKIAFPKRQFRSEYSQSAFQKSPKEAVGVGVHRGTSSQSRIHVLPRLRRMKPRAFAGVRAVS